MKIFTFIKQITGLNYFTNNKLNELICLLTHFSMLRYLSRKYNASNLQKVTVY